MYSVLGFVFAITLLAGVHELGHFSVARLLGVKVLRFSIGFGKALWSKFDKLGTEYVFAAIPLGGYVKMQEGKDSAVSFDNKPVLVRMLIIAAGPVFNLIFAVLAYWVVFMLGIATLVPISGTPVESSIAASAGLKSGQEIIAINDKNVSSWEEIAVNLISISSEKKLINIQTKDLATQQIIVHKLDLNNLSANKSTDNVLKDLGLRPLKPITPEMIRVQSYTMWPAFEHAVFKTGSYIKLTLQFLGKMAMGQMSLDHIAGPISIGRFAGHTAESGLAYFISFLALISISLGVLNMLPIPILDGGHFMFCLIELVRGKPLSAAAINFGQRIGFTFLGTLMVLAVYNDFVRILHPS